MEETWGQQPDWKGGVKDPVLKPSLSATDCTYKGRSVERKRRHGNGHNLLWWRVTSLLLPPPHFRTNVLVGWASQKEPGTTKVLAEQEWQFKTNICWKGVDTEPATLCRLDKYPGYFAAIHISHHTPTNFIMFTFFIKMSEHLGCVERRYSLG